VDVPITYGHPVKSRTCGPSAIPRPFFCRRVFGR